METETTDAILTTDHPVAQCVDLRATFGRRFRYVMDESFAAEQPEFRAIEKPWLTRIPCRFGFIAPHGGLALAAYSTTRRRALAALPCVTVYQGGDGATEVLVHFDVKDIQPVADLLEARRPRAISPETRARLAGQGFQVRRETPGTPHAGRSFSGLERAIGG